ncbi:MAG: MHYT domain-containing protein [Pseudomonadota bacterium]
MPLDVSHDPWLVIASFAIALMAGFTGLSATRGAQALAIGPRKRVVATAAVILGGGIWSMHFVAMLGLQLPVPFFYDPLITLISALLGILIVGVGLLLLHFTPRRPTTLTLAGVIFGTGILVMHYVGMSGMEACRAAYTPLGILLSVAISLPLSVLAIWVAYGERTRANIVFGTMCFAAAVVALHYLAIAGTTFIAEPPGAGTGPMLSNEALAFIVTLAAFVICGLFLLSGATFLPVAANAEEEGVPPPARPPESPPPAERSPAPRRAEAARPVPYEQNGRTLFADPTDIAAFRAEGHYTIVYLGAEKVFCPWSISEAETRLASAGYLRAHRSYLVNPSHVSGFERKKDGGIAYFDAVAALDKVPVARSRLPEIRTALGL